MLFTKSLQGSNILILHCIDTGWGNNHSYTFSGTANWYKVFWGWFGIIQILNLRVFDKKIPFLRIYYTDIFSCVPKNICIS